MKPSKRSGGKLTWARPAALALAVTVGLVGLWLAVGAGASNEASVRAEAYPMGHEMALDKHPAKQSGSAKATFKFHDEFNGNPYDPDPQYERFDCKLDRKPFKECESPQTYKGLTPGKHKFAVKLVYDPGPGFPSSLESTTSFRWKVK